MTLSYYQLVLVLAVGYVGGKLLYEGRANAVVDRNGNVQISSSFVKTSEDEPGENVSRQKREVRNTLLLTSDQIDESLDHHHYWRSQQNSSNMKYMYAFFDQYWNATLADYAQEYGDTCQWGHGQPNRSDAAWDKDWIGQNMYFRSVDYDVSYAIKRWHDEIEYYDYDTSDCNGPICGHYTQLTWANSQWLGCGKTECSNLIDIDTSVDYGHAYMYICNYGPGGNVAGTSPFKKGDNCTECESEKFWCYDGMCRDCAADNIQEQCECAEGCVHAAVNQTTCTCTTCNAGWQGSICDKECVNINANCGNVRGWKVQHCTGTNQAALEYYCPAMCGLCEEAPPTTTAEPTTTPGNPTTSITTTTTEPSPSTSTTSETSYSSTSESTTSDTTSTTTGTSTTSEPTYSFTSTSTSTTSDTTSSTTGTSRTSEPTYSSTSRRTSTTSDTISSTTGTSTTSEPTVSFISTSSSSDQTYSSTSTIITSDSTNPSTSTRTTSDTTYSSLSTSTTSEPTYSSTSTITTSDPTYSSSNTSPGSDPIHSSLSSSSGNESISSESTTAAPAVETAPPGSTCDSWACYNGATLILDPCQCVCVDGYQGEDCSAVTEEATNGIEVQMTAQLEQWVDVEPVLLEVLRDAVNDLCIQEDYYGECCPGSVGMTLVAGQTYVTLSNMMVGTGYPVIDSEILIVLIYVELPETSSFCNTGSRRKRSLTEIALPQDVLYTAVSSVLSNLTTELEDCCGVTVQSVDKGQNETGWSYYAATLTEDSGLEHWALAVIVVCAVIVFVAMVVVVLFLVKGISATKNGSKVHINESDQIATEKRTKYVDVEVVSEKAKSFTEQSTNADKLIDRLDKPHVDETDTTDMVCPPVQ